MKLVILLAHVQKAPVIWVHKSDISKVLSCRHRAVMKPLVPPSFPLLLPLLAWMAALIPSCPVFFIFVVRLLPPDPISFPGALITHKISL